MVSKWGKKRSIMRRYNSTAQMYDTRYGEEQEAKYKVVLEVANVAVGDVVLDAGCGSGLFFGKVTGQTELVVGVDISRKMLQLARQRAQEFLNVCLVLADADHLPFKEEVFSRVFAFTMLQNMPKPAETLAELKLISRSDAIFVVTGLKAAMTLEALDVLLDAAGLRVVSLRSDDPLRCYVATCVQRRK